MSSALSPVLMVQEEFRNCPSDRLSAVIGCLTYSIGDLRADWTSFLSYCIECVGLTANLLQIKCQRNVSGTFGDMLDSFMSVLLLVWTYFDPTETSNESLF